VRLQRDSLALDVPGFELAEAARTRSFWMICAAQVLRAYVSTSAAVHLAAVLDDGVKCELLSKFRCANER
jgi:hypothetical protein